MAGSAARFPRSTAAPGLGITEASIILEEVNRSGGNATTAHAQIYVMGTLLRHGSEEQKKRYLPRVASGELRLQTFGVTEPNAGSETTRIETSAVRNGDRYVVNGQKVFISRAQHSDLMLLLARTTPYPELQDKTRGLSVFLVDMKAAVASGQIEIKPLDLMINQHTTQIFFQNLEVPAENIIGDEGMGFRYIIDGWNAERILVSGEAVGDGHWFVDRAARYASERVVFGRPIGSNQGVQFPIAQAYARIEAADLMRYKAGWLFDHGQSCGAEANMAKLLASQAVMGGGERRARRPRRLWVRSGVRHRAEIPRDAPVHNGAHQQQSRAGLPWPARARDATLVLMPIPLGRIAPGRGA